MRRALAGGVLLIAAVISCRNVLGLGDPEAYGPDASTIISPNGEVPVTTQDAAACDFANLVTDPKNCGKCGHDCRGGRCERARCVPTPVTEADTDVFTVHSGNVYTVSGGKIIRAESIDQRFQVVAAELVGTPRALLASELHIVWSGETTGVRLCSLTGCGDDGAVQLSAKNKNTGPIAEVPALGGLYPYLWANYTDNTVEKSGLNDEQPVTLSLNTHIQEATCVPQFSEVDGGAYVYDTLGRHFWVYRGTEAAGRDAGGAAKQCALAANATAVFYTDTSNVWRAAINADGTLAPPTSLASNVLAPRVLVADDEFVYWAASTEETDIVRCRATGCGGNPEVLVEEVPGVQTLISEGAFLYFNTYRNAKIGHAIYKVAK